VHIAPDQSHKIHAGSIYSREDDNILSELGGCTDFYVSQFEALARFLTVISNHKFCSTSMQK
jgi:hypothetical protein